jgi:hypothetical protein
MLENKKKKGILIRSRQEFFEEDIDNIEIFKLAEEKRGDRREITAVLDNMGQIRENKQEVIDVVYNFYADLYKWQNIGLDEIKEYLTHLDLKKLDEEDWTYFDNFLICPILSKTAVISLRSPLFSSANLKISMLSISSSKNSCLDRIKIPLFFLFSNMIICNLLHFLILSIKFVVFSSHLQLNS